MTNGKRGSGFPNRWGMDFAAEAGSVGMRQLPLASFLPNFSIVSAIVGYPLTSDRQWLRNCLTCGTFFRIGAVKLINGVWTRPILNVGDITKWRDGMWVAHVNACWIAQARLRPGAESDIRDGQGNTAQGQPDDELIPPASDGTRAPHALSPGLAPTWNIDKEGNTSGAFPNPAFQTGSSTFPNGGSNRK